MYCCSEQIFDINNLKEKTFVLDHDLRAFGPWSVDSGLRGVGWEQNMMTARMYRLSMVIRRKGVWDNIPSQGHTPGDLLPQAKPYPRCPEPPKITLPSGDQTLNNEPWRILLIQARTNYIQAHEYLQTRFSRVLFANKGTLKKNNLAGPKCPHPGIHI